MPFVFDMMSNTNTEKYRTSEFHGNRDDYDTPAGKTFIPKETVTLTQLNQAVFVLKPVFGMLDSGNVMDIHRKTVCTIFGTELKKPSPESTETLVEKILRSSQTPAAEAARRLIGLNLFSQATFLFSLNRTIEQRLQQHEGSGYDKMPRRDDRESSLLELNLLTENSFEVIYQDHLSFITIPSLNFLNIPTSANLNPPVIDGNFLLKIIFTVVHEHPISEHCINTFPDFSSCLFLEAKITEATFTTEEQSQELLSILGFTYEKVDTPFHTPLASQASSPRRTPIRQVSAGFATAPTSPSSPRRLFVPKKPF